MGKQQFWISGMLSLISLAVIGVFISLEQAAHDENVMARPPGQSNLHSSQETASPSARSDMNPAIFLGALLSGEFSLPVQSALAVDAFSPPLGFRDGFSYEPRVTHDEAGQLIEDTGYGVKNPDLEGDTCFGVEFNQIYHAGEDWYRRDGSSTAGAEVTAVADGQVVFADPNMNFPGLVVIVEHSLTSGEKLYSVYAHLDDSSVEVEAGQTVTRRQRLGAVMYQEYTGRYPEYHPSGDDSHLHYELRRFYSGLNIYPANPACNGLIPGRGYTYPQTPDSFPLPEANYTKPSSFSQTELR